MHLTATQHLVCSAYRPPGTPPFEARWRSETVVALTRGIVADEALDRMPILADALEEAGCDSPTVLRHCRECQNHTSRCWVLGDVCDQPAPPPPVLMSEYQVRREVERVTGQTLAEPSPGFGGFRSALAGSPKILVAVVAIVVLFRVSFFLFPSPVVLAPNVNTPPIIPKVKPAVTPANPFGR